MNRATGENKTCACGNVFFRTGNDKSAQWKNRTRCSKCRKSTGHTPDTPAEPTLGRYKVNNPILDKFLRG